LSMCFTIRHGKCLSETLVSAIVSEAATSRLGLVSDKILNVLVSETWVLGLVSVSAQKVSCTSLSYTQTSCSS